MKVPTFHVHFKKSCKVENIKKKVFMTNVVGGMSFTKKTPLDYFKILVKSESQNIVQMKSICKDTLVF